MISLLQENQFPDRDNPIYTINRDSRSLMMDESKRTDDHFEYVGNLHIHSLYSDGAGSVRDIARTAQERDLDFIILNDHEYMTDSLHLKDEGIYIGSSRNLINRIKQHHYGAITERSRNR